MKQSNPIYALILIILFSVWIWVPFVYNALSKAPEKTVSVVENRMLAESPKLDMSLLDLSLIHI